MFTGGIRLRCGVLPAQPPIRVCPDWMENGPAFAEVAAERPTGLGAKEPSEVPLCFT